MASFTSSTAVLWRSYFHDYECPEILTPSYSDGDVSSGTSGFEQFSSTGNLVSKYPVYSDLLRLRGLVWSSVERC